MGEIKPRPTITSYGAVPTGLSEKINRIDIYRTKRKKWQFWKDKYDIHTLALCDDGVYEIFPPDHKPHPPLFTHTNLPQSGSKGAGLAHDKQDVRTEDNNGKGKHSA